MPNQQTNEKNGSVDRMIRMLDICAASQEDNEAALLLGMAAKALSQLQSHADRVMTETMDWQDRYDQMGQSYDELMESNINLEEENARLLLECQQLEADDRVRSYNDMSEKKIDDHPYEKEERECTAESGEALLDASPRHETNTPVSNCGSFNFSGDVYKQLDQFELSLDMELEDFQELCEDNDKKGAFNSKSEKLSSSPCCEVMVGKTLPVSPLQDKTPSKDDNSESNRNPFQLLRRLFPIESDDVSIPAMTTSDSMFSVASDHSISMGSRSSDLYSLTATKKTMGMSSQGNAEWAIFE